MYKVLIVDDSSFVRKVTQQMLLADPELSVVGEAQDGYEAVHQTKTLDPDVIVLDLIMPQPDGIWIVEKVFKEHPVPIVLFSSIATDTAEITEELFRFGILDVVSKPAPNELKACRQELISKVKAAAKSKSTFRSFFSARNLMPAGKISSKSYSAKSVVAVVASAGSPAVLMEFLKDLSAKCKEMNVMKCAVVVALHMPHEFLQSFVKAVDKVTAFPANIAKNGDIIRTNKIYFSPGKITLCLNSTQLGMVVKLEDAQVNMQPHFNSFLKSVAETFGKQTTVVVLSGMGNHGLEGAIAVKRMGGKIVIQDPKTAGVGAMPQSVLDSGIVDVCVPVSKMTEAILKINNS